MTLALYGKSRRRQVSLVVIGVIGVLIAIAVGITLYRQAANALTLGSASGTWTAITGGPDCQDGLNTNEVRWGKPKQSSCGSVSDRSGYRWDGNSNVTFSPGQSFLLGKFTHYNNPVYGDAATSVTLDLPLVFTDPSQNVDLTVVFNHDETPNNASTCKYTGPGVDNSAGCADRVQLPTLDDQQFQVGDSLYKLEFTGFLPISDATCPASAPNGTPIDVFYTKEAATNRACVYAKLTFVEPVVHVDKAAVSSTVNQGDDAAFKITVANSGKPDATGWSLSDQLPVGFSWTIDPAVTGCSIDANQLLTCSNLTIPQGTTKNPGKLNITVKASTAGATCGPITNPLVTITKEGKPSDTGGPATVTVKNCATATTIQKSNDATNGGVSGHVTAGGTFNWTLAITVSGAKTTASQDITDTIPAGLTVTANPTADGGGITCDSNTSSSVHCTLPKNTNPGTYHVTIPVQAPAANNTANCKAYTNTAYVGATASNEDTVTVDDCAQSAVSIVKSNDANNGTAGHVNAGGTFNWTLAVSVTGGPTTDVQDITDTIPAGLAVASNPTADGGGITCDSNTSNSVHCTLPANTGTGTYTITIPVKAPSGDLTANCTTYPNTAYVGATPSNENTVTVDGCAQPGVSILKSHDPDGDVNAGATFDWVLKVTVSGGPTAADQPITDPIPAGFVIDGDNIVSTIPPTSGVTDTTCSVSGQDVTCPLPAGTVPGVYTITIPVKAPPTTDTANCTTYPNTAYVGDTSSTIKSTDSVKVVNCGTPAVDTHKTNDIPQSSHGKVEAGDSFNWILTTTVSGAKTTARHTIDDDIPAGFTVNSVTPQFPITCSSGVSSNVRCELPSGANIGAYTVTINVTAPAKNLSTNCKPYTNTAQLDNVDTNTDTVTVKGCDEPVVSFAKSNSTSNNKIVAGGNFTWDLTVNVSNGPTQKDVVIDDTIPSAFTIGTSLPDGCQLVTGESNKVECTLATNAANGAHTFKIPVTAPAGDLSTTCGPYTNTGSITAGASGNGQTTDSDTVTVTDCAEPNVSFSKSDSTGNSITAGGNFTWDLTVTVSNGPTQKPVVIDDTIPSAFTIGTSLPDDCQLVTGESNKVECTLATNAANGAHTFSIPVTAPAAVPYANCGPYTNSGSITSGASGNGQTSDSDTVTVTGCTLPTLTLSKSDNLTNHTVEAGAGFNWLLTVTVTNGPTVQSQDVTDTIPAGFVIGNLAGSGCSLDAPGSQSITCTVPANTNTTTFTIPVTAPAASNETCGPVTNTAHMGSQSADDTVTVHCQPAYDLAKTNNIGGQVSPGGAFNWIITATVSNAPTTASKTIIDNIPSDFTINGEIGTTGGTGTAGKLTCSAPSGNHVECTLASGAGTGTYVITVPVLAPAASDSTCKTYTNTATMGDLSKDNQVTLKCQPAFDLQKTDTVGNTVEPGASFSWIVTATVSNTNTEQEQTIGDTLPGDFEIAPKDILLSGTGAMDKLTCGSSATPTANISCTLSAGARPGTYILTIPLTAPAASDSTCTTYMNTATFNGLTAHDSVTLDCKPAFGLTKTDTTDQLISSGGTFTWTITATVSNTGLTSAQHITDPLPAGFTQSNIGVSGTGDVNLVDCSASTATNVDCTIPSGAKKGTYVLAILVKAPSAADGVCKLYTNTATLSPAAGLAITASDDVTVTCLPVITVLKTDDTSTGHVNQGGTFNWNIAVTVHNTDTDKAQTVTDDIPADFTVGTISANSVFTDCGVTDHHLSCTLPAGTPYGAYNITIPVTAPLQSDTTCHDYDNTAYVNPAGIQNSDSITVDCTSTFEFTKADDTHNTVGAGGTFNWTLTATVHNTGTGQVQTISDPLPTGFTADVNNITIGGNGTGALTCTNSTATNISCTLPAGSSKGVYTVTVPVTAPTGTEGSGVCKLYTNTASFAGINAQDDVTVTDCTPATFGFVKSDSTNHAVAPGGSFDWILTATVANGPTTVAKTISDTIPSQFTVTNVSTGGDTWLDCSATSGNAVSCSLKAGATNGNHVVTVTVTAPAASNEVCNVPVTNQGSLGDITSSDNVTVECEPVLGLTKTDNTDHVTTPGGSFNWVLTATVDHGPTTQAYPIKDTVPAGFVVQSVTKSDGVSCAWTTGQQVDCSLLSGSANGTYTVTIAVKAPAASNEVCNVPVTNQGSLGSITSSDNVTVECEPVLGLTKTDNTDHVTTPGGSFNWVLTATVDHGPTTQAYPIKDTVPAGFVVQSVSPSTGVSCAWTTGQQVDCSLASGSANGTYTVTIAVKAPAASNDVCNVPVTNQGSLGDITSSDNVTVECEPITTLAKSDSVNGSVNAGASFNWVLTATVSHGPTTSVQDITDSIPDGFVINGVTAGTGVTCERVSGQDVACHLPQGTPNGEYTVTINVTAPHASAAVCGQSIPNTAHLGELAPVDNVVVRCQQIVVQKYNDPSGNLSGNGGLLDGWTINLNGPNGLVATGTTGDNGTGTVTFLVDPGSYTVAEVGQSGWTVVGSTVDGVAATGAGSDSRSVPSNVTRPTNVDFFNQALGSISIVKVEASVDNPLGVPGAGWNFTVTGCGITRTGTTGANGTLIISGLPLCTYTVTEDTSSKPGFTISPTTPNNRHIVIDAAGESRNVGFTNYKACTGPDCVPVIPQTPTPVPSTPTPTTPTPTPTTSTPTPTPTTPGTTVTPPAPTQTTTPTPVPPTTTPTHTPAKTATPLPPQTGSGAAGGAASIWFVVAGLGLVLITGLLGATALRRKHQS